MKSPASRPRTIFRFKNACAAIHEEEDALTSEHIDYFVSQGDGDAHVVQQFERDFEEMLQEIPDLQQALVSYQAARQKITDRRRSRGFWPAGKSKGKGGFKAALDHIARSSCLKFPVTYRCANMDSFKRNCVRRKILAVDP